MVWEQSNLVLCLKKILLKYIAQENPLLISFPASEDDAVQTSPRTDNLQLVGSLLQSINVENIWPVYVYQLGSETLNNAAFILPYKPYSYVIFIGPEKEELRLLHTLQSQLMDLSSGMYFNHRAVFIIVVIGYRSEIKNLLNYMSMLWMDFRIDKFITMTAKSDHSHYGIHKDMHRLVESKDFDIYSCFPYEGGMCGNNVQAVLVDRCYVENSGELTYNIDLFPNKVPNNFAGCELTVFFVPGEPYVVGVNESTDLHENAHFTFRGLKIEYLLHVTEVLNLTAKFDSTLRNFFLFT
jgi:hypothetical protein